MKISLICACKNRYDALRISLSSWLAFKEIVEIIIVDWDSDESIAHLSKLDKRIKIIEVKNRQYFNQPQPLNLAASIATGDYILKVDCDYVINPYYNLFESYPVDNNSYLCGKNTYKSPEVFSEQQNAYVVDIKNMTIPEIQDYLNSYSSYFKYLIGLLLVTKDNFNKVGGFNENLTKCYAYEDEELFQRLSLLGLEQKTLTFDHKIIHIPHPDKKRTENFQGFDWEKDYVEMVRESMSLQGYTGEELEWQIEYALAQKHIAENRDQIGEITEYYVEPKTKWKIKQIGEQNYFAIEVVDLNL